MGGWGVSYPNFFGFLYFFIFTRPLSTVFFLESHVILRKAKVWSLFSSVIILEIDFTAFEFIFQVFSFYFNCFNHLNQN